MKRYEKYKEVSILGIDKIPNHWSLLRLKNIGFLYGGLSGKAGSDFGKEDSNFNRSYIPFKNIANNRIINPNQMDFVEIQPNESQNEVLKGDLLFLMSSENYDDIGKTAIVNHELKETYLNSFCKGFRTTNSQVFPLFLNYILSADQFRKALSTEAKGFTRINLQIAKITNLSLSIPPLSEQHQIAAFLDHKTALIDEIIAKKERLIELLQAKRQATINEVVTGKKVWNAANQTWEAPTKVKDSGVEWLGEIPEEWEVVKLKYLVTMKSGNFISADLIEQIGEYPVFGGNGIRGYHSEFTHDGFFPLIGRQGALCGNINYAKGKFWATEHAVVVEAKKEIDLYWLGELLRIMNLNQYSIASAQPGLSVERIINLHVPLPKESNQILISHFIKNFEKTTDVLVSKLHTQIQSLKSYRQSLISEAVTGKIDVREWEEAKINV